MFVLRTLIEKSKANKHVLYACFVYFSKAFDTVLHSALFVKLHSIGVTGRFFNNLNSMYGNSYLSVKIESNSCLQE
jgi:hypothetical protein